jgi:two-component system phosphate regulon sensor histidine kinase PhoR
VSHELKTPLTVLNGYIEMIEDSPLLDEKLKRPVSQMAEHSKRMQSIVRDLLYLSKLENTSRQSEDSVVNVTHLLQSIVNSCRPLIEEKHHRLELNIDEQHQLIGSRSELQSAFSNLIVNAINYTPENGKIEISWQVDPTKNNDELQGILKIKDNGAGIPHAHLERLTERFYRIDDNRSREKGGTGLGLSIVKNVLERHNATLMIDSTPGAGSEFSCLFETQSIIKRAPIELASDDIVNG